MADEEYDTYHVPQQSRRDKLRVLASSLYNPPPDFLSSSSFTLPKPNNSMGFINNPTPIFPNYSDPINPNYPINPNPQNPFLNYRNDDAEGGRGGGLIFNPEPLSLSLSSSHSNLTLPAAGAGSAFNDAVSRCSDVVSLVAPTGPFTGYASVLEGSRFMSPAQQLLHQFFDVAGGGGGGIVIPSRDNISPDPSLMDPPTRLHHDPLSSCSSPPHRSTKSRLISMLDEVYRRYKQYYQQMQAVVTSFERVAGLADASPFTTLALKAMSKHFRSLKNAINDQLNSDNKDVVTVAVKPGSSNPTTYAALRHIHSSDPPVWRPQRGLPERAVIVLRAWLFDHFLHPYPSDTDKVMLAKQSGLSRNQVSNWFINARVRLWKPMVEEIHMLETQQHADDHADDTDRHQSEPPPPPQEQEVVVKSNNKNWSTSPDVQISKRTRNGEQHGEPRQQMYSYGGGEMGMEMAVGGGGIGGGGRGVSLTLGLRRQQGKGLMEPATFGAQRFGIMEYGWRE
ncbi:BEL1-like homeodomain protein 9 [Linum grandiflorum]